MNHNTQKLLFKMHKTVRIVTYARKTVKFRNMYVNVTGKLLQLVHRPSLYRNW